jgi:hypothetical protein
MASWWRMHISWLTRLMTRFMSRISFRRDLEHECFELLIREASLLNRPNALSLFFHQHPRLCIASRFTQVNFLGAAIEFAAHEERALQLIQLLVERGADVSACWYDSTGQSLLFVLDNPAAIFLARGGRPK